MTRPILCLSLLAILSPPSEAGRCVQRVVAVPTATVAVATQQPQTLIQTQNVFSTTAASSWGGTLGQISPQQQYEFLQQIERELRQIGQRQQQLLDFANRISPPQPLRYQPQQQQPLQYQGQPQRQQYQPPRQPAGYGSYTPRALDPPRRRQDPGAAAALSYGPPPTPRAADACSNQPARGGDARSVRSAAGDCRAERLPEPRTTSALADACARCHGPRQAEAELRLDRPGDLTDQQRRRAVERMLAGEMPPDLNLTIHQVWQIAAELMTTEADRRRLLELLSKP